MRRAERNTLLLVEQSPKCAVLAIHLRRREGWGSESKEKLWRNSARCLVAAGCGLIRVLFRDLTNIQSYGIVHNN